MLLQTVLSHAVPARMPTISRVVIEGFRVYRNKLEPAPFSPRHNVVGVCKTSVPKESFSRHFVSLKAQFPHVHEFAHSWCKWVGQEQLFRSHPVCSWRTGLVRYFESGGTQDVAVSKPMHSSPLHSESHFTTKKCQSACDTSPLDTFPLYTFIPLLRRILSLA